MLIRFSVENFLSYNQRQTLDLSTANTCKEHQEDNTFVNNGTHLLKSAVIYGANASGKSNLFIAMSKMTDFIINSSKESQANEELELLPFLLNTENRNLPSKFEIEFAFSDCIYRYGFEADKYEIKAECLFRKLDGKKKEYPMFLRLNQNGNDEIQVFKEMEKAKGLEERTRKNALFLSVCAQFAVKEAEKITKWFLEHCNVISGINTDLYQKYTVRKMQSKEYREEIVKLIRDADLNIQNFTVEQKDLPLEDMPDEMRELLKKISSERKEKIKVENVRSVHNVYDNDFNVISTVDFDFDELESTGTQKALGLAGPIIDTLKNGTVLWIDELGAQMHPIFTRKIVQLFNSKEQNPNNAQLIFATHDVNLLNNELLRRDQIWFAEKNHGEATELYSLIEFILENKKKVRNDASYSKDYLNGRYGAIPFLGNFKIFGDAHE